MISLLFISLAVLLLLGIPVGFAIGMASLISLSIDPLMTNVIVAQKFVDGINSFTLMALPLFILSGAIMVYGSTPRLMNFANMMLRKKRWGIGNVGILGCAAFGTISGSGVATTAAIGSIVAPEMVKKGYDKGFTASIIAGAGTLGTIIPPSIGFVVYAQIAGVSISDMFLAGIIPGIMTAWILVILNKYMVKKHNWGNDDASNDYYNNLTTKDKIKITVDAILPLLMPVIILGGVLSGAVTPTEAAAVACIYAFCLAIFVYKEMKWKEFYNVLVDSAVSASTVLIIMGAATPFAWLLTYQNVTTIVANWVFGISNNVVIVYGIIIVILLILGFFMETLATILMTVPMFLPILVQLGVDPIAYGITSALCACIGAVTPPLAVCLFTSCKIVKIRVEETFPTVMYVVFAMLFATILTAVFPQISTFLPSIF